MDNVTHSLIGLAIGEIIHRSFKSCDDQKNNSLRRALLLVSCVVASNFPDLDLIFSSAFPPPIGYLLMHRGHTHTILYAFPQAILLMGVIFLIWPGARRLFTAERSAKPGFALSVGAGFALHLMLDFLNSYGIHPFYPIDAHWYFGDMVFIVEPFFWATIGTAAVLSFQRRWLTIICSFLFIVVLIAATFGHYLASFSSLILLAFVRIIAAIHARAPERGLLALYASVLFSVFFLAIQRINSQIVKQQVAEEIKRTDSGFSIIDTATTAFPSNPFCWIFHSFAVNNETDVYRVRTGVASVFPKLISVQKCPKALARGAILAGESGIAFLHTAEGQSAEFHQLAKENCFFAAWLRFARMPIVGSVEAFDVRFSTRDDQNNFTRLWYWNFKNQECPQGIPGWVPPRADFLGKK